MTSGEKTKPEKVAVDKIRRGPRLRDRLTDDQLIRMHIFKALLGPLDPFPLEQVYDDFTRDHHPEDELHIWERAALIVALYRNEKKDCSLDEASQVLHMFLSIVPVDLHKLLEDSRYRQEKEQEMGIDTELALNIFLTVTQHPQLEEDEYSQNVE